MQNSNKINFGMYKMNNIENFDSNLATELFSTFDISNDSANELEASSSDNATPLWLLATVTGAVEC